MALSFFLDFVRESTPRISYAASFGTDDWQGHSEAFTEQVAKNLHRFKAISVREQSGVEICNKTFGVQAHHVLDPTLLIEREYFDSIIASEKSGDDDASAIVYYKLDPDDAFLKMLSFLGEALQTRVQNIYYDEQTMLGRKVRSFFSVPEWLRKIRSSRLVVTDSFHCVCFAVTFGRNFLYVPNNRGITRLESLLGLFDLKDRIVQTQSELEGSNFRQKELDVPKISSILVREREQAMRFLENAFKDI